MGLRCFLDRHCRNAAPAAANLALFVETVSPAIHQCNCPAMVADLFGSSTLGIDRKRGICRFICGNDLRLSQYPARARNLRPQRSALRPESVRKEAIIEATAVATITGEKPWLFEHGDFKFHISAKRTSTDPPPRRPNRSSIPIASARRPVRCNQSARRDTVYGRSGIGGAPEVSRPPDPRRDRRPAEDVPCFTPRRPSLHTLGCQRQPYWGDGTTTGRRTPACAGPDNEKAGYQRARKVRVAVLIVHRARSYVFKGHCGGREGQITPPDRRG